jgi:DNA-binding CsgD family transcriptional regulator
MIVSSDLKLFSAAVLELYAPGLDAENYVERTFRFISALVPSDMCGYGGHDPVTKQLDAAFDSHPPGLMPALQAYGQLMHKYPAFSFDPALNDGKPYSTRDFYTRTAFRDLDIYQEVNAPLGFDDQCYVNVPSDSGVHFFLGLFRAQIEFVARDKELLALAQPHLANVRRLALAQREARDVPPSPEIFARMGFTPRGSEVLYWLTQGRSNREIASILHIRTDSVSAHLQAIYEKMGVENRVAATLEAFRLTREQDSREHAIRRGEGAFRVSAGQPVLSA